MLCGSFCSGKIIEKEYGKSKVYFADQSQFPEIDEAELQRMDEEITALSEAELEKGIAEIGDRELWETNKEKRLRLSMT